MHRSPKVLVFRTDLRDPQQIERLKPALDGLLLPDHPWNFDLEDRDRILRVEAPEDLLPDIVQLLADRAHQCVALE
ncbi:MAG: hypothetical protein H6590_07650 [Flavobacteriales bacterium]|nr:hypothetical protein [Flavobacteriales bacterium]